MCIAMDSFRVGHFNLICPMYTVPDLWPLQQFIPTVKEELYAELHKNVPLTCLLARQYWSID